MSLTLSRVSHRYGSLPVLVDVDLVVGADETVALFGPSGSGKTTLLSIVGGLLRPTEGQVTLDGAPVGEGRLPAGSFSWIFQTINLIGRRTALENVALGLLAVGYRPGESGEMSSAMLSAIGLAGLEQQPAMKLSGGEAQRVGVARALVGRPRFVLADEPTGQLDRSSSELVAEALFSRRPQGTSVIAATHDPAIAARCDRRYTIIDGQLRQDG